MEGREWQYAFYHKTDPYSYVHLDTKQMLPEPRPHHDTSNHNTRAALAPDPAMEELTTSFSALSLSPPPVLTIFSLSPELRNEIYRLAFKDHSDDGNGNINLQMGICRCPYQCNIVNSTICQCLLRPKIVTSLFAYIPALLQTSKQVRQETQQFYFASQTFTAQAIPPTLAGAAPSLAVALDWCLGLERTNPKFVSMVKNFVIDLGDYPLANIYKLAEGMAWREKARAAKGLEVILPSKLRTLGWYVLDAVSMSFPCVEEMPFVFEYSEAGEKVRLSSTEVFCPFCGEHGEPEDRSRFREGCCWCCVKSFRMGEKQYGGHFVVGDKYYGAFAAGMSGPARGGDEVRDVIGGARKLQKGCK